ncbi:hypothetical protein [Sinorhizobium meliloti]|uniref:hypothetical protein n=1 Tax=Rhizobium meliloti TaxID=382 RepID=UPI0013E2967C|nr:hypothetical protein [Sinorhizobium meliloti]
MARRLLLHDSFEGQFENAVAIPDSLHSPAASGIQDLGDPLFGIFPFPSLCQFLHEVLAFLDGALIADSG